MLLNRGRNRILLHLENQDDNIQINTTKEVPFQICQKGIAEATCLSRGRTTEIIGELSQRGFVKEHIKHVVGLKRRRKVYTLTQKGRERAENIRGKIEDKEIIIYTDSEEFEINFKQISSYIHTRNPMLVALNNMSKDNTIDLTKLEKRPEDIFSGRDKELQFLCDKLNEVKNERTRTVLLKGKAGIGKTRVINEFKLHHLSKEFEFMSGSGRYDNSEPYLPFKEAFKDYNIIHNIDFSSGSQDDNFLNDKDVNNQRNLVFSKATENIKKIAEDQPFVVFFDDLQYFDKASLKLFHHLIYELKNAPILFICAYRPEDVSTDDFLNEVLHRMNMEQLFDEIELEPLNWNNTKEIIQGLIGRIEVPDDFVNIIHDTSEGNPLFTKELVKQMVDDDIIDLKNNKYVSKKDDINLPNVIEDIIKRRINKLDRENLKILQIGSIIGEEIPFSLLKFISNMDAFDILEYVDILTGNGLWDEKPDEDIFYFTHGLIRLSVYKNIPLSLRKDIHKKVAESMEEIFENEIQDYYSDIGFHYKRANKYTKGFEYYVKAGKKAEKVYAYEDAEEMYKEAFELIKKGDLNKNRKWKILEKLGDINIIKGNYDDSLNYLEKIPMNEIDVKSKQKIIRTKASVYEKKGEFDKALVLIDEILDEKCDMNIESCRLLYRKGLIEMHKGKYDLAENDFLKALEICKEVGDDRETAQINQGLGMVNLYRGEYKDAINNLEKALRFWKKVDDLKGEATSLNLLGNVYSDKGRLNKSLEYYQQSLKIREKIGDKLNLSSTLNNIGTIHYKKGNLEKAIEYHQKSLEIRENIGNKQGIAVSLINLGTCYFEKGDLDYALKNQERGLKISEKIKYKKGSAASLGNLGKIYSAKGELKNAKNKYLKGLEISKNIGFKHILPHFLIGIAEILIQEGNIKESLEKGKEALKISDDLDAKLVKGISYRVLGMAYRKEKKWEKSKNEFEKGKSILKSIEEKKELAELLYQYALLWKDMDNEQRKKEYLKKALSTFEDVGMKLWIEKCEDELNKDKQKPS